MEILSQSKSFGGWQYVCRHDSQQTRTPMRFALYLPPQAADGAVPLIWWLSGLTCTEENFIHKAGAQQTAAECGAAIVVPDTSPRGAGVKGENDGDDIGAGAGFYVDAAVAPWRDHYRMFSYLTDELPALLAARWTMLDLRRQAIMGHSMGGHGALILALKTPGRYCSVSAFAPICRPSKSAFGQKAFAAYLGDERRAWEDWDAVALIRAGHRCPPILIDQGEEDEFLPQLHPADLAAAAEECGQPLTVRMRAEYDHSYYFVATFIAEHIRRHAECLAVGKD